MTAMPPVLKYAERRLVQRNGGDRLNGVAVSAYRYNKPSGGTVSKEDRENCGLS